MTHSDISDNHLKVILQNYLNEFYPSDPTLKGLRLCGCQAIKTPYSTPGTTIIDDGEKTYEIGTTSCRSSWSCPRCSAIRMAKYGEQLACLIDYLAQKHTFAYMVTLTIPHSKTTPLNLAMEVLTKTWRKFQQVNINNKKEQNPFVQVKRALKIEHIVRCYEVTYGKNGFHAHIHALYFTAMDPKILKDREDDLCDYWLYKVKQVYLSLINKFAQVIEDSITKIGSYTYSTTTFSTKIKFTAETTYTDIKKAFVLMNIPTKTLDEDPTFKSNLESESLTQKCISFAKAEAELLFSNKNRPKNGHRAYYISTDKDNKPKRMTSSYYITDSWSGDKEVTGHEYKKAHDTHDTMYSLLTKGEAVEKERLKQRKIDKLTLGNKAPHPRNKYFELYIEYAKATKGRKRFQMTIGDQKLVKLYKQTHAYEQAIKKKQSESAEKTVVCWFTSEQWLQICYLERSRHVDIRSQILHLAKYRDWRLIHDFILQFDIYLRPNEQCPHLQFAQNHINTTEEYQKAIAGA